MNLLFKDMSLQGDEILMSVKKTYFFYVIDKWFLSIRLVRTRPPGSFSEFSSTSFAVHMSLGE